MNTLKAALMVAVADMASPFAGSQGLVRVTALAGEGEVRIYGPIGEDFWSFDGGNTHEKISAQIRALQVSTLRVYLNTPGGVVDDGVGIHNTLRAHPARKIGIVESMAASIGSAILCACDEVHMYASSQIMIHAPQGGNFGTEESMRSAADALASYKRAMAPIYARKTGRPESEFIAIFDSQTDHYFTATEAKAFGLCDVILDTAAPVPADELAAAAQMTTYAMALANAPATVATEMRARLHQVCASSTPAFARLSGVTQRAVLAHIESEPMKQHLLTALAVTAAAGAHTTPPPAVTPPAPAGLDPISALRDRNTRLDAVFAHSRSFAGVADLERRCLADVTMTVEAAQTELIRILAGSAAPIQPPQPTTGTAYGGIDEAEKLRAAASDAIVCRAAPMVMNAQERDRALQGNPFANRTLLQVAEVFALRQGLDVRNMAGVDLAQAILRPRAQQSTSDFPILLESAINRVLKAAYRLAPTTWQRFCAIGSVPDLRASSRYDWGSFSSLTTRNQSGEFSTGTLSDGEKETITADWRGRILRLTPEVLINDDLQVFSRAPQALAQAAARTLENRVFALLAENSNAGPTMSDASALFTTGRGNLAASGTAPSTASFDACKVAMASRKDVGNNDYLDIRPAIWLGPLSIAGAAAVVNAAEFDHDSTKLQKPNIARNTFSDIVGTPRLSGTRWYAFADPNIEPVIEVAFLNGQQEPRLVQEENFNTAGLAWRVDQIAGVAAVGHRGAYNNPGA